MDLMLRNQKYLPCPALKQVSLGSLAERDFLVRLATEDDHVGKVAAFRLNLIWVPGVLSEDLARGKYLKNGVCDDFDWREGEVTGIVLETRYQYMKQIRRLL